MRTFFYQKERIPDLTSELMELIDEIGYLEQEIQQVCIKNKQWKQSREVRVRENLSSIESPNYVHAWEASCSLCDQPFSEQMILQLYSILMPQKADGGYKKRDNFIIYEKEGCMKGYAFLPPGADEMPEAMRNLLEGYAVWERTKEVPALVMIGCFLMDFICIHPFSDGNGRMSRILFGLLLQMNGYPCAKYLLIENYIKKNRALLIRAERRSQKEWYEGKNDYLPIILFYVRMLKECYLEIR